VEYPVLILEVIVLVGMSAVFSGLNISLMSLDPADLRRKATAICRSPAYCSRT